MKSFRWWLAPLLLLATSAPSIAQAPRDLIDIFGGIAQSAVISAARSDWEKLSGPERVCIEQQLRFRRLNIEALIRNGITPTDPRVADVRGGCRVGQAPTPTPTTSTYRVAGVVLGSLFSFESPAYREYNCSRSDQFPNLTYCSKRRDETEPRGRFVANYSMLHDSDGRIVYVNRYQQPAYFTSNEIDEDINRLSRGFRSQPVIVRMPPQPELPVGLLATWGNVLLETLDAESMKILAEGKSPQKGMLIDFIGDFTRSAKIGLPVYALRGGSGYVWAASHDREGRGTLRFAAVDASSIAPAPNNQADASAASSAPDEPTTNSCKKTSYYVDGLRLMSEQRYFEAETVFRLELAEQERCSGPGLVGIHYQVAIAVARRGRFSEALQLLERAITLERNAKQVDYDFLSKLRAAADEARQAISDSNKSAGGAVEQGTGPSKGTTGPTTDAGDVHVDPKVQNLLAGIVTGASAALGLGLLTGYIAHRKGHSYIMFFVFGTLLFVLALPIAIFMRRKTDAMVLHGGSLEASSEAAAQVGVSLDSKNATDPPVATSPARSDSPLAAPQIDSDGIPSSTGSEKQPAERNEVSTSASALSDVAGGIGLNVSSEESESLTSKLAELEKFAKLRADGVLTDDEFEMIKRRLLPELQAPIPSRKGMPPDEYVRRLKELRDQGRISASEFKSKVLESISDPSAP